MNADGSNQISLTDSQGYYYGHQFSPDGTKIAFALKVDFNYNIYIMDIDGSNLPNLTEGQGGTSPQFSPDGSRIVFSWDDIYIMDIDGSNRTNLTNRSERAGNPHFSSDGSKIVFQSGADSRDIYIIDSDGSNQTNLTNSPNTDDVSPQFQPLP